MLHHTKGMNITNKTKKMSMKKNSVSWSGGAHKEGLIPITKSCIKPTPIEDPIYYVHISKFNNSITPTWRTAALVTKP